MAYRRALSVPSTLLARRFSPISFTYISHHDDRSTKSEELHSYGSKMETFSNQRRSLVSYAFRPTPYGLTGNAMYMSLRRGISTSSPEATQGVACTSEVLTAASDSTFPIAAVQYLIDYVHTLTGLNWWASIAVATFLVRGAMIPLFMKVSSNNASQLRMMNAQLTAILRQMEENMYMDRATVIKLVMKMVDIVKKGGISPHLSFFAHSSIMFSFYFAVMNMAEKVPSFKTGGALWFTDLSTPDFLYIFPTSLTLLTLFKLEILTKIRKASFGNEQFRRALAVLWIPARLLPFICPKLYSAS